MDIITDNSTQSISSLANVNGTYNPFITASDLTTSLASKQDTLTSGTTLLGVGSSISALDYGKITLNLPTYFPTSWANVSGKPDEFTANWNTTITNKPDLTVYYNKSESDAKFAILANNNTFAGDVIINGTLKTLSFGSRTEDFLIYLWGTIYGLGVNASTFRLNAPADASYKFYTGPTNNTMTLNNAGVLSTTGGITLTGAAKFTGDGSGLTALNYNNITNNALSFQTPLSKNTQNQVSINLSDYSPTTTNDTKYLKLDGTNNMTTNAGITLTGTGKFTGDGSLLTALNYNNITNNALSFQTPLSKSVANVVSIDLSTYGTISVNDGKYIKLDGTNTMTGDFRVYNGKGQIRGASTYANITTSMIAGSLVIGDTSQNFGGGTGWNTNTAGLLMECDSNTEIAVHDNGTRIASLMYYAGGATNEITIGRDMYWGAISKINLIGNVGIGSTLTLANGLWHKSADGVNRIYFTSNAATYFHSGNGYYAFKNAADTVENLIIDNSGNIDIKGGIAINGSTAFFGTGSVDATNTSNTYLNFKYGGTNNDWCYLRQIGGDNAYKLAFDFHDDADDARFCIRKIQSTASPDTVAEVFTVDNGNVSCTGTLTTGGTVNINNNGKLIFNDNTDNIRLQLYSGYGFGIGINPSMLRYNSGGSHTFFNGSTQIANIQSSGIVELNGIWHKGVVAPLIKTYLAYATGNGIAYHIYYKNYPNCLFYITMKSPNVNGVFGVYAASAIIYGTSFAPELQYNGGITNYVPYFTNQFSEGTIMWIYNAQAGVQISITEYWYY